MAIKQDANRFYFEFFAEQTNNEHRPEGLAQCTTGELLGELDDIVQVLARCNTADYQELLASEPGMVFTRIKKELAKRLNG